MKPGTPDQTSDEAVKENRCMTGRSRQGSRKLRSRTETPDQAGGEDQAVKEGQRKTGRSRQGSRKLKWRPETPD